MTDPSSITAQPLPECPYICPNCKLPATDIMVTSLGALMIFWHGSCKVIINVQMVAMPQQLQPKVIVPGRVS